MTEGRNNMNLQPGIIYSLRFTEPVERWSDELDEVVETTGVVAICIDPTDPNSLEFIDLLDVDRWGDSLWYVPTSMLDSAREIGCYNFDAGTGHYYTDTEPKQRIDF